MKEDILSDLRSAALTRGPLDTLPEGVWKRIGALNTWGTNAIEGNTLTWADVQQLLLEGRSVSNRPVPDVLETLQHESAFRGLLLRRDAPIRSGTARELHEAVFRGVRGDAGAWRRVNVRIVGTKHLPPRLERVPARMADWEAAYASRDAAGEAVFSLGAWMHFEFESIHPFSDGNGRAGRLLLNLHFLKHSWPPVHVLPPDRARYLRSLDRAHTVGLGDLEAFLREAMARSLLDLLDQIGTREDELKPLKSFERRGRYSAKYLALRASQGELPSLKASGDWRTSARALGLYRDVVSRAGE
jgi:Fic family protein